MTKDFVMDMEVNVEKQKPHGRETIVSYYGDAHILKHPLAEFSQARKDKWLEKQYRAKAIIDEIKAVNNLRYNIPGMIHIEKDDYAVLEERAPGEHLTPELYKSLSRTQQVDIKDSMARFLVDMNELKPVFEVKDYSMVQELKMTKFTNMVDTKLPRWLDKEDIDYVVNLVQELSDFKYDTIQVWTHSDLNSGNVLYDVATSKISFIDFADSGYNLVLHDIFSPLNTDLGISKALYEDYKRFHDEKLYKIPGVKNADLQNIVRLRPRIPLLKRFIKCGDDLRLNPRDEKSVQNSMDKAQLMHDILDKLRYIESCYSK